MEGGFPMLNCLMQHTLRSLCTSSDSSPTASKWVYAVFWRIVPRNYPPPIWEHGGGLLEHAKANKRNWIIVWEDGFCDFCECLREGSGYVKGRFGAHVFFKLSHEVYSYGEGLVGKVAAENSHKWIFNKTDNDQSFPSSSWNELQPIDPKPKAWEAQFNSGIETIAVMSVRDGVIQLGSFEKIAEDPNLVLGVQRKFNYLQSINAIIQRPRSPLRYPDCSFEYHDVREITGTNETICAADDNYYKSCGKRKNESWPDCDWPANKSVYFGYNSPQNGFCGTFASSALPPS